MCRWGPRSCCLIWSVLLAAAPVGIGLVALVHRAMPERPDTLMSSEDGEDDIDEFSRMSGRRLAYAHDVGPLLVQFCVGCHNAARRRGGVAVDDLREDTVLRDLDRWRGVAHALRSGRMPPPGKARPSPAEADALLAWLDQVECAGTSHPPLVRLRRLNRAEYNNTIHDLVGVSLRPADDFPADDLGYGFDTIADVLSLAPVLLEKYLDAAERIVDEAARSPGLWARIMNPPSVDSVPFVLRGRPPVRAQAIKDVRSPHLDFVDPEQQALEHAVRAVQAFADRAYRRPVTHEELGRLVRFLESARGTGDGYEDAVKQALKAILVSPHFLFRIESAAKSGRDPWTAALADFELAARLSYFLWSSMPDGELFDLAGKGRLSQSKVFRQQVRRMLRDPKASALAENFAAQWLQTRGLKDFTPDPAQFPLFDEPLRTAMARETELFFEHIVRDDRDVLELLTADYTFLNQRLARHYGIGGVFGPHFRKVPLAGTPRGGVITHASVLSVTSNPTRTSPVKRGKWILENILGAPPPPPPPGADNLKAAAGGHAGGTLRQRLQRHRSAAECASCHARMDGLGFGLENFDAIGAWRSHERQQPIDASGDLGDGRSFHGPDELRALLAEGPNDFVHCLTEKMLTYALGRGLGACDRCAVESIVRSLAANGRRFSSLIIAIVMSDTFWTRTSKGSRR
jgi:hypothetical protein